MNRDRPKSVSLTSGFGEFGSTKASRVSRMSGVQIVNCCQRHEWDRVRTLKLDISMDEANGVHPTNCAAKLSKYPAE